MRFVKSRVTSSKIIRVEFTKVAILSSDNSTNNYDNDTVNNDNSSNNDSDNNSDISSGGASPDSTYGEELDRTAKIADKYTTREEIEGYFDRKRNSIRNSEVSQEEKDSLMSQLQTQEDDVKDLADISLGNLSPGFQPESISDADEGGAAPQDSSDITNDDAPFDIMDDS